MLHIRISGHKNFSVTVYETDTVRKIKEIIKEKDNISNIDKILLLYRCKLLKNDELLKDLKIHPNTPLKYTMEESIIGGGGYPTFGLNMANIANKKGLEKRNFCKNANEWNTITKGLNIEGECNNSNCIAYNHKVDCKIGLGDFNLLENICKIKCPMCSVIIEPGTCSFNKCQYQIEGTLSLTGEIKDTKEISTEWIRVEKDYDYYDPIKSGKVRWFKLVIHTKDL